MKAGWSGTIRFALSVDVRYRGQGYELNITDKGDVIARFHAEHQRRYGYHHPSKVVELVTVRLRATLKTPSQSGKLGMHPRKTGRVAPGEIAHVIFDRRRMRTPVYDRAALPAGQLMRGPAVITEYSATTVIPPRKRFRVDRAENLLIDIA